MKRTRKLQLAMSVLSVTAAVAGFALMGNPLQAKAEEEASFAMVKGAYVRAVENEAGIRWETSVNQAWYNENIATIENVSNVSFGTLVTSAKNVSVDGVIDIELLDENAGQQFKVKDLALSCEKTPNFNEVPSFTYHSSIVYTEKDMQGWTDEEKLKAYATELVARSYVKYSTDGGVSFIYEFAEAEDTARCMRAVSLAAYEDTSDKAPTEEEKGYIDHYFKNKATDAVALNGDAYYEKGATETFANTQYTVAYAGAKKVGTLNGETATLEGLELGKDYTLTLFDAAGNYAKTSTFKYVTQTLDDKTEFLSVIHPSTATTLTGYYVMTADIDVSSSTAWTATAVLNGTLDGGNHKLTGLNFAQGSGIFANVTDETMTTTVKNINITDATLLRLSGVIMAQTSGNITLENVYISLASQKFGERRENYVANAANVNIQNKQTGTIGVNADYFEYKSGVVYSAHGANSKVTVKNSVIYMPEFVAKANGFVAGVMPTKTIVIDVDDCTFIGGNGRVWGYVYNQGTLDMQNSVVCGAAEAHQKYKANWTDMQKAAYDANHPYVELNNENIAAGLKTLTNHVAVLTEDIDASTAGIDTNYHKNNIFTGVFDGQGHTVNNLTASNWTRGMFLCGVLKGSCKNVAFTNVQWGYYTGGVIALSVLDGYVGNVYIEQTDSTGERGAHGAIAETTEGLSMKDVVVYTKNGGGTHETTTAGLFAKQNSTFNIMQNCYYVTYNENDYFALPVDGGVTSENLGKQELFFGIQGFKGENAKASFDAAVEAGTVTISDTLKGLMYPTATDAQ